MFSYQTYHSDKSGLIRLEKIQPGRGDDRGKKLNSPRKLIFRKQRNPALAIQIFEVLGPADEI